MRNMRIDHQQVIATHFRQVTALRSTTMNSDALANTVTIADFYAGWFASIFQILIHFTNRGKLIDLVIAANFSYAIDDDVGLQHCTFADFHLGADIAKRANMNAGSKDCAVFNDGTWMDKGGWVNHVLGLPA